MAKIATCPPKVFPGIVLPIADLQITQTGLEMIQGSKANSSQVRIIPAKKRDAARNVSHQLDDLLGWARHPDPTALNFGWADAYRRTLNDVVDSAVCAFAGNKQAIPRLKSVRTLALDFIGLMVDRPKLSTIPPEEWPVPAYRQLFDDLAPLQREFRIMGDAVETPSNDSDKPATVNMTADEIVAEIRSIALELKFYRPYPGEVLPATKQRVSDFLLRAGVPFGPWSRDREILTSARPVIVNGAWVEMQVHTSKTKGIRDSEAGKLCACIAAGILLLTEWQLLSQCKHWTADQAEQQLREAFKTLPDLCDELATLTQGLLATKAPLDSGTRVADQTAGDEKQVVVEAETAPTTETANSVADVEPLSSNDLTQEQRTGLETVVARLEKLFGLCATGLVSLIPGTTPGIFLFWARKIPSWKSSPIVWQWCELQRTSIDQTRKAKNDEDNVTQLSHKTPSGGLAASEPQAG